MLPDPKSDFGKGFAAGIEFALALQTYLNGSFGRSSKPGDVCMTQKAKDAVAEACALSSKLMDAELDAR